MSAQNFKAIERELTEAAAVYVPRKPWTTDELKLVAMFYNKVPVRLLAQKLGRTVAAVHEINRRNKVVA